MVAVLERFLRFLRTFFSDEITVFDMLEQCPTHTERERERERVRQLIYLQHMLFLSDVRLYMRYIHWWCEINRCIVIGDAKCNHTQARQ
jgi:hypothetical protein